MLGHDDVVREAEARLVGAALLRPALAAESGLKPGQFFDPRYQLVWAAVGRLQKPTDPVFEVADALADDGALSDAGGMELLTDLVAGAGLESAVPAMVSVVRRAFMDRTFAVQLSEQLEKLRAGVHADDLFGGHIDSVERLRQSGAANSVRTAADLIREETEAIEDELRDPGAAPRRLELPWGLDTVVPGGCPPDKLTVLFGPTGGFKSTIANGFARHFARHVAPDELVVKFGLEDSAVLEAQKLIADVTRVPLSRIVNRDLSGRERAQLRAVDGDWLTRLVLVDDVVPTPDEMIRAYRAMSGVRAVFYDYIQLIDWEGRDERIAIHNFCVKAQRAAKRDRVAHIALSQLREDLMEAAEPADKRPRMQWLFGGSATRNTSKLIIGVYRPWSYFPDPSTLPRDDAVQYGTWARENPEDWKRLVELVVRKNQLGGINGILPVLIDLETGAVEEW